MSDCATGCGRPTDVVLCNGCLGKLRTDLGDVGWLDTQLMTVLARQTAMIEHAGGRSAEVPLPINRGALKARSVLRNRLVSWSLDLADRHGETEDQLPGDTLPAMAAWMLAREARIAVHPAADELFDEIHEAVIYARMIVDLPANRTTFPVGPCPEVHCPGEVRAYIPAADDVPARMECTACGMVWDTTQWSRAGKRILARMDIDGTRVDTEMASLLLGVTDRTVRRWVEDGRLTNHGDQRRVLVDLADLERVVDAA